MSESKQKVEYFVSPCSSPIEGDKRSWCYYEISTKNSSNTMRGKMLGKKKDVETKVRTMVKRVRESIKGCSPVATLSGLQLNKSRPEMARPLHVYRERATRASKAARGC